MDIGLKVMVWVLSLLAFIVFLGSCVITLSDGQGALVFAFSIPIMVALLIFAIFISRKLKASEKSYFQIVYVPKTVLGLLLIFFSFSFVPVLRRVPETFLGWVGTSFVGITGKTPKAFFRDRASFSNKLSQALLSEKMVSFSKLDVTFAWDKVCVFGPYTNNDKAKQVLNFDFSIEERSQIHHSDSINALVFLFQGRVNQVVDLERSIADFKDLDICVSREKANFDVEMDASGKPRLKLLN